MTTPTPSSPPSPTTRRRRLGLAAAVLSLPLMYGGFRVWKRYLKPDPPGPYDRHADAQADLNRAIEQARRENKKVLVIFGANWCPNCQKLNQEMQQPALHDAVQARYVVTKVDVGYFDRNGRLVTQLGNPVDQGIPAAKLIDAQGQPLGWVDGPRLVQAQQAGHEALLRTLETAASATPQAPGRAG